MMHESEIARLLDDARVFATPALFFAPETAPTADQRAAVDHAIDYARRVGLHLPPFIVRYVSAPRSSDWGETGRFREGAAIPFAITLNVDQPAQEFRVTAAHEVQHVCDMAAGWSHVRPAAEQEHRCDAFAREAMRTYPEPERRAPVTPRATAPTARPELPYSWGSQNQDPEVAGTVLRSTSPGWARVRSADGRCFIACRNDFRRRRIPREGTRVAFQPSTICGVARAVAVRERP